MKKIVLFGAIVLFLVAALPASSLTLEDAIASAKDNSVSLEIAQVQLRQSLRSASDRYLYLPSVTLNGSIGTTYSPLSGSYTPLSDSLSLSVSYSLGTSLIGKKEASRIATNIANLTYAASVDSLESSVTASYLSLQSSLASISEAELSLEKLQSTYKDTKEKYEKGSVSELAVFEAELALKRAEQTLSSYKELYELSLDSFKILTGLEGEITLAPLADIVYLDLPTLSELLPIAYQNSVSLRLKEAQVQSSKNTARSIEINSFYPSVAVSVGYNAALSSVLDSSFNSTTNTNDGLTATVAVSLPITNYLPGSSADNSVKNARDSVEIATLQLTSERDSIRSSLSSALNTIKQRESDIELSGEALTLALKTQSLKEEAYDAGLATVTEVLDAASSVSSARLTLSNAELSYVSAVQTLSSLLGVSRGELEETYGRKVEEKR